MAMHLLLIHCSENVRGMSVYLLFYHRHLLQLGLIAHFENIPDIKKYSEKFSDLFENTVF